MRESCLDCVRKHLGQAAVLMHEAIMGHPLHRWLAIGHLAEAEVEICKKDLGLALEIREHRHAYTEGEYEVPILDLIAQVGATDVQEAKQKEL